MIFSRISFKLVLIVGISLLGMIAMAPIALSTLRSQMIADRQAKTQHMVDVGYGILAHYQKLESDGKLSREQAQAGAMAEIKSLRYDKVEYFWINDMTPKMVMHPIKPELDGKDLSAMKDPAGNALFLGFVDVVKKQGAGFYGYLWPKPGFDQPVGKISYVKGFAPWGWIIGTGIYLDDVDAVFRQDATTFALVCLAVFALVLGASFVIGRSVTKPLAKITALTERLAGRRQRLRCALYRSPRRGRRARQGARRVQGQCVGGGPDACRAAGSQAEGRRREAQDHGRSRRQVRGERAGRGPRRLQ
ncbi:signal transduction histidine kinase [Bradyrhizobium sp. USDA 4486]